MSTLFDDSEEQVWLVPDAEEDGDEQHAITDRATHLQAVVTARAFSSGRAAARIVMGNGRHQVGAGPIMKDLDFKSTCVAMLSLETPTADRIACAKAIGDLAQVVSNATPLREAGAVAAAQPGTMFVAWVVGDARVGSADGIASAVAGLTHVHLDRCRLARLGGGGGGETRPIQLTPRHVLFT